jgi:glycosyltransferase involved in cell wall biosynthesis
MVDKKIKIAYILPKFDLQTDSHFFYLHDFINLLAEKVDLFLLIEDCRSDLSFFKNLEGIKVQRFKKMPWRFLENLYYIIVLRLHGCKKFYIHYSYISAFNASLVARLSGAKTFYWSCGMMWLFGKDYFLSVILKMINFMVTGVHALVPGYQKYFGLKLAKVKVLSNWVDVDRFQNNQRGNQSDIVSKYNLSSHKKYILFVHRLVPRKGAHYLVSLAQKFINQPELEFLVVGTGPYVEQLKKEIQAANLNNLTLLGKVPNLEVPALMRIAKVFIMPSEEEGFPRVLLEAMASDLPYVAFDVGGVREISPLLEQTMVVPVGDIDAMANCVNILLDNQILCRRIKEQNQSWVEQYDLKVVVNKFIKLFYE